MGVDGTYKVTADTPMGRIESTLVLNTDGDNLNGSFSSAMMGSTEFSGGKVDGDSFTFEMTLETAMGRMEMTNNGTVDGDNISGEVKTAMGNSSYTGVRV